MVMALRTLGSPDVGWEVPAGKSTFYNLCVPFFCTQVASEKVEMLKENKGKQSPLRKPSLGWLGSSGY